MSTSRAVARSSRDVRQSLPRDVKQAAPVAREPSDRPFVARAKLFANGRSQAVRLPKEFRLEGTEVLIHREGRRLVLEPVDAKGWPVGLWEQLDALAAGSFDDWQRPADPVPPPIGRERDLP